MKFSTMAVAAMASVVVQAAAPPALQGQMTEKVDRDRVSVAGKQRDNVKNGGARLDAAAAYCPELTCPDGDCCYYDYPYCCSTFCCPPGYPYCGYDGRCYDR